MKKWFYKNLWWFLTSIGLLTAPFILNWVIQLPTPYNFSIVGDSALWLVFWGTYIAGATTLLVVILTMRNHKELKLLQINTVKYVQANNNFDKFRSQIQDNYKAIDIHSILDVTFILSENSKANMILNELLRKVVTNKAFFNSEYSDSKDADIIKYTDILNKTTQNFVHVLRILIEYIAIETRCLAGENNSLQFMKEQVLYRKKLHLDLEKEKSDNLIIEFIDNLNKDIDSATDISSAAFIAKHFAAYVNKSLASFNKNELLKISQTVIQNEKMRINDILTTNK